MLGFIHLLGIPFVLIAVVIYVLGHLIAYLGAFLVTAFWLTWKFARWLWIKAWLWSVDKRVSRAI